MRAIDDISATTNTGNKTTGRRQEVLNTQHQLIRRNFGIWTKKRGDRFFLLLLIYYSSIASTTLH